MSNRTGRKPWAFALLATALTAASACGRHKEAGAAGSAEAAPGEVLAEGSGVRITRAEVDERAAGPLAVVQEQEYEARKRALDELVAERLLGREAAARGMSTADLLKAEVEGKQQAPTPQQIDAVYAQHKSQLGGRTREQATPDIERFLREQAASQRRAAFEKELKAKASLRIALVAPRRDVPVPAGAPALGPSAAAVTVVEYLDYQCPYCRRAQGTVDDILRLYDRKVRFVHRDFPLPGHPGALPAARAVRCAEEQGKFWEFHHNLLAADGDLGPEDLRARAAALGLKGDAFAKCLSSDRHDADIRVSADSGAKLGVNSTPTFFVNGRRITGALPLDRFQEVIEEELAGSKRAGS